MAPKFPDEIDVFAVPHTRMKALVEIYMDQLAKTDFGSNGAMELLLENLAVTFYELKSHEYIENQFIMDRLKRRLKMVNVTSQAVCNCHEDGRLAEVLKLLRDGYSCSGKSAAERLSFGLRLQKAVGEFTAQFLPHMQEEEDVFQPLLMKYFAYDELRSLKELVIEQHEMWKQKLLDQKVEADNFLTLLSSLANEVADYCSSDSDEEFHDALQAIVELTCENLVRRKKNRGKGLNFNHLPQEMIAEIFSYLNPQDRTRCARVCKLWNILIYSPHLWREVYPTNWTKGFYDFKYRDPYLFVESEWKKRSLLNYDCDEDLSPEAERQAQLYEQFIIFVLPRIGEGVQRLVVAGGSSLTSEMLQSMLILCPNLLHLDASYCSSITDSAFRSLARQGACSRITYLDLSGCSQVTDVGLQRLGDCFRYGTTSWDILRQTTCCKSCQQCPKFDAEYEYLLFEESSPGISHLNLSGCCYITDYGLQSLLDVSLRTNSLTFLDLSGCSLVTGEVLNSITCRSSHLLPKDLYYCNMIEGGPYPTEANGCQNLTCPVRGCCCTGE